MTSRIESLYPWILDHLPRLTRFGVVGISGVIVNTAILYALVEWGHLPHLVGAAMSSEVSILSNFALNDRWTFRDTGAGDPWGVRAMRYNVVAFGGMLISLTMLAVLMTTFHLHYLVANLCAIAAATLSNYALNSRYTWVPIPVES